MVRIGNPAGRALAALSSRLGLGLRKTAGLAQAQRNASNCNQAFRSAVGFELVFGSRLVRSDPHQLLAEVRTFEHADKRAGRAVETLSYEFAVLYLALAHPLRHVTQELR